MTQNTKSDPLDYNGYTLEQIATNFNIGGFLDDIRQWFYEENKHLDFEVICRQFDNIQKDIKIRQKYIKEDTDKIENSRSFPKEMSLKSTYKNVLATTDKDIFKKINKYRLGLWSISENRQDIIDVIVKITALQELKARIDANGYDMEDCYGIEENGESDPTSKKPAKDEKGISHQKELDVWDKGDKSVLTSVLMELEFIKWLETKGVDKQYQQAYAVRKILNMDKQTAIKDTDRLITFYKSEVPKNREVVDKKIKDFIKDVKDFTNK